MNNLLLNENRSRRRDIDDEELLLLTKTKTIGINEGQFIALVHDGPDIERILIGVG